MKLRYLLLACFILTLNACQWGLPHNTPPAITTDTLAFVYQNIKQRANDCGTKPDSACSVAAIRYPVFKNAALLNDAITTRLLHMYTSMDSVSDANAGLQKYAADFIHQYEKGKPTADPVANYTMNSQALVLRQDSGLVTLYLKNEMYAGGAHGGDLYTFINWNTRTSRLLKLDDLFIKGYHDQLTRIADTIFRKNEKLNMNEPLTDYFFKDYIFALNDNYLITPTGIVFLYNEYEIKSYAEGTTKLAIPYSKIKSLLLPHTVISQYIK